MGVNNERYMGQVGWSSLWSESKDVSSKGSWWSEQEGKGQLKGGISTNKGHDRQELCSASVENELRFNLDDSAKQALDEQKENGCKMGRLCIGLLTQETKNKISFSSRVYIRGMESETSLSL